MGRPRAYLAGAEGQCRDPLLVEPIKRGGIVPLRRTDAH